MGSYEIVFRMPAVWAPIQKSADDRMPAVGSYVSRYQVAGSGLRDVSRYQVAGSGLLFLGCLQWAAFEQFSL